RVERPARHHLPAVRTDPLCPLVVRRRADGSVHDRERYGQIADIKRQTSGVVVDEGDHRSRATLAARDVLKLLRAEQPLGEPRALFGVHQPSASACCGRCASIAAVTPATYAASVSSLSGTGQLPSSSGGLWPVQ